MTASVGAVGERPDPGRSDQVRRLIDSFIDPFMIFEPVYADDGHVHNFRYVDLNRAACDYAGVVRDDLVGRTVLDLYPGEQGSALTGMYIATFESGTPLVLDDVHLPEEAVHADRYADIRVTRVDNELHYTMRDATSRHEAVRRLAESEARYRLLAENSSDVVYLRDFDGVITWVSPSIHDILGWEPVALIGTKAADMVHPDDRPGVAGRQRRLGDERRISGALVRVRSMDGTYRVMSVAARVMDQADTGISGVVISLRDVDELVRQREAAEFEAARRVAIVEALLDPHVLLQALRDDDGRIVDFIYRDANEAACAYNGRTPEQLVGARLSDVVPGHRDPATLDIYRHVVDTGESLVQDDYPFVMGPAGSDALYFDLRAVRVGEHISLTWRDVTDRHRAAEQLAASEARYRLLAENSSDVVLRTRDGVIVWASPSLTRTLGFRPEEWVGTHVGELAMEADAAVLAAGREHLLAGQTSVMRVRVLAKDGDVHWVEVHSQQFLGDDGAPDGFLSTFRIVDDEVAIEQELERRARFDDLTGVLKRDEAIHLLEDMGRSQREPGRLCGVLFVDIDGFKSVNDRWGHSAGDAVLLDVASQIKAAIRGGDTVARLGGDEFLVILDGVHDLGEAQQVAEKIRVAVAHPGTAGHGAPSVTVSVGVTVGREMESGSSMVTRADDAMYTAKRSGRNRVVAVGTDD